jgi:hypothetical protein
MRSGLPVVALLVILVCAADARAQDARRFYDGNWLFRVCGSQQTRERCLGYVAGAADGIAGTAPRAFCIPERVTLNQVVDVVMNWLRRFPQVRQDATADVIVNIAISDAWPCAAGG